MAQAILCRAITTFSDGGGRSLDQLLTLGPEDRRQLMMSEAAGESEPYFQAAYAFLSERLRRTEHLRKLIPR